MKLKRYFLPWTVFIARELLNPLSNGVSLYLLSLNRSYMCTKLQLYRIKFVYWLMMCRAEVCQATITVLSTIWTITTSISGLTDPPLLGFSSSWSIMTYLLLCDSIHLLFTFIFNDYWHLKDIHNMECLIFLFYENICEMNSHKCL